MPRTEQATIAEAKRRWCWTVL